MNLIDFTLGGIKFTPHENSYQLTISDGKKEVTIDGFAFSQYVGECFKRKQIAELEAKGSEEFIPE